jgi:hypothetical protein
MNKDTVVASVIGFGLGLVAAIVLWVVPRILPKTTSQTAKTENQAVAQVSPKSAVLGAFTIANPQDGEISKNKTIKIEGAAPKASVVIVSTASGSAAIAPKNDGSFSTNLDLNEGVNEVIITSLNPDKEEVKNLNIYYFAENI